MCHIDASDHVSVSVRITPRPNLTESVFLMARSPLTLLPVLAIAALLVSGCSFGASIGSGASDDASIGGSGTGKTSLDQLQSELHCDDMYDELEQLVLKLNDSAAPGLSAVNMYCYRADDTIGIDLLTTDDPGVVDAAQLESVLDVLATFTPSAPVGSYKINAWDVNYMQGTLNNAAYELGVQPAYIDQEWDAIVVPADELGKLFG